MSDFQTKTQTTARAMAGIVAMARAGAKAWSSGTSTHAYADRLVTEAEEDAGSIINTYDSRQPPTSTAIELKDRLDQPLQNASSSLTDLRIALRRSDHRAVDKALSDLAGPLKSFTTMGQVGT